MTNDLRSLRGPMLAMVAALGLASCNMNVSNPSVIDAGGFDPTSDGQTLSLSAQTNFFIAFQGVALFGGLISDEVWTGAVRLQTNRLASRTFLATDDINPDFFAPLSLAVAANRNAVTALERGPNASSDVNLARAEMNLGYALEIMAETMCASVIQGGPQLSDAQLLDTAITALTKAVSIGTAAGSAAADIVDQSKVGLARAYLQVGDYTNASQAAGLVPSGFVANVITSANASTLGTLANQIYRTTIEGQLVAPKLYRVGDPRLPIDSTQVGSTLNNLPYIIQTKFTSNSDPIRLASGLEAQYIGAEATLHGTGSTTEALTLIAARRSAGGQPAYGGATDTLSVMSELLNQRARDFWIEGKKLGDLRRNPSVPLQAVLTDTVGAPFYTSVGGGVFGST
ncbi:MAG TPA: hypothetical protein VGV12_16830, partial [Gemmatimonadales bacterium]|nr:hypothetical protein [Gemmatimonadales bacterium]